MMNFDNVHLLFDLLWIRIYFLLVKNLLSQTARGAPFSPELYFPPKNHFRHFQ